MLRHQGYINKLSVLSHNSEYLVYETLLCSLRFGTVVCALLMQLAVNIELQHWLLLLLTVLRKSKNTDTAVRSPAHCLISFVSFGQTAICFTNETCQEHTGHKLIVTSFMLLCIAWSYMKYVMKCKICCSISSNKQHCIFNFQILHVDCDGSSKLAFPITQDEIFFVICPEGFYTI